MSSRMSIRLDQEVKERLENLAAATNRSRSSLAAQAIREYVENNEWQIEEIQAALVEVDAGDFVTAAEVDKFARKWNVSVE